MAGSKEYVKTAARMFWPCGGLHQRAAHRINYEADNSSKERYALTMASDGLRRVSQERGSHETIEVF